jgi:hypothetical protein
MTHRQGFHETLGRGVRSRAELLASHGRARCDHAAGVGSEDEDEEMGMDASAPASDPLLSRLMSYSSALA